MTENNDLNDNNNIAAIVYAIIHVICFFVALYISFKCNEGFQFGSFLAACCCAPIYVIYKLAVPTCNVIVGDSVKVVNWMK